MELSFAQIQEYTMGALTVTQDNQGFHFTRFTPAQRAEFAQWLTAWGTRADYTSGVCIDFHTDATRVSADIIGNRFEILVDDLCVFAKHFETEGHAEINLDGQNHRITMLMPSHYAGILKRITLTGASYTKRHTYYKKLAFYGDSITQGNMAQKDSQNYASIVTRYFDFDAINFGVGGVHFQPKTVVDVGVDPDVVIVSLGTNVFASSRTIQELYANCVEYFQKIANLYSGKTIFCITPIWRADGDNVQPDRTFPDICEFITKEAQKHNFIIIDGYTLMPHRTEYYNDGRLHPNDIGFAQYARNVIKAMTPYV